MTLRSPDPAWIALSLVERLGGVKMRALLDVFGSADAVLQASEASLQQVTGVGPALSAAIRRADVEGTARKLASWSAQGVLTLAWDDPHYPNLLHDLKDPPPTVFVLGRVEALTERRVRYAIVGTRRPSRPAYEAAQRLGYDLACQDGVIVSGLAAGIDAAAHSAALASSDGYCIAVLGSGVLNPFPPEHKSFADRVAARGCLISEVDPDARASTPALVARNRLIAALSDAVIVAETENDGGAMYAARAAITLNRRLYTLDLPASGNRALLEAGAIPILPEQPLLPSNPSI